MTEKSERETNHAIGGADKTARPEQQTVEPLLTIDLQAELASLLSQVPAGGSGRQARTLVKDAEMRVVLIALRPGARLAEHHAPGRITIHTLAGHLTVRAAGQAVDLPAGHILTLARAIAHDVEAREESAFLLTIASPTGQAGSLPAEGA